MLVYVRDFDCAVFEKKTKNHPLTGRSAQERASHRLKETKSWTHLSVSSRFIGGRPHASLPHSNPAPWNPKQTPAPRPSIPQFRSDPLDWKARVLPEASPIRRRAILCCWAHARRRRRWRWTRRRSCGGASRTAASPICSTPAASTAPP